MTAPDEAIANIAREWGLPSPEVKAANVLKWAPHIMPPGRTAEECRMLLERLFAGDDAPDVVEGVSQWLWGHSHHDYNTLVDLAINVFMSDRIAPRPLGRFLKQAMTGGKMHGGLCALPHRWTLEMLRRASPETLMDEEERAVFEALPAMVEAWRGGKGATMKKVSAGLSWTIDPTVAQWFARRWDAEGVVVRATFPREAVFAYFDSRNEKEIVVDWRRARKLAAISSSDDAAAQEQG